MNRKKSVMGFTLVEVMISTAILVTVLGAMAYGINQSLSLTRIVRNQDIAVNIAQAKLEEIANSDLSELPGSFDGSFSIVEEEGLNSAVGTVAVGTVAGATGLFNVSVTVDWQQNVNKQLSRTITTTLLRK